MDSRGRPNHDVRTLIGCGNVLREAELAREVNSDLVPIKQMLLAEVVDHIEDIVVSGIVPPQLKGLLTGVKDVSQ